MRPIIMNQEALARFFRYMSTCVENNLFFDGYFEVRPSMDEPMKWEVSFNGNVSIPVFKQDLEDL